MSPTTRSRGPHGGGGRRGGPPRPARASQGPPIEPLHPSSDPPDITSFEHWALAPEVLDAIAEMGITSPTPIQRLAIQPALERRDVIAQAETGTGKTLAFGAPVMSLVDPSRVSVQALVLTPTRELAEQVAKVLEALGRARDISVVLIVGGEPAKPQVDALKKGAQVVVGTPGRVLDLMGQGFLSFPWTEFVVLDEADEMLEIGFLDDVEKILLATDPEIRNTLLFSATFPPELLKLARKHSQNPAEIATASGVATVDTIEQDYFVIHDDDRPMALIRMIEQSEPDDVLLIFCERRTEVERLIRRLERLPFPIKALHGGYDQEARFRVMGAFRRREVKALVATDVASRGLDVEHVTHVVNYSVPRDVTSYTHRIGRTGRAGREGHATTLVPAQQARRWQSVLREATWKIQEIQPPGPTRRGETRRSARPQEGSRGEARETRRAEPERPAEPRGPRPEREDRGARRAEPRAEERPSAPRERRAPEPAPAPEPAHSARERDAARPPRGEERDGGGRRRNRRPRLAESPTAPAPEALQEPERPPRPAREREREPRPEPVRAPGRRAAEDGAPRAGREPRRPEPADTERAARVRPERNARAEEPEARPAPRDRGRDRAAREERPAPPEGRDRPARAEREERSASAERRERPARAPREERLPREERAVREERSARPPREERAALPPREERTARPPREERTARPPREERPPARPERTPAAPAREQRAGGFGAGVLEPEPPRAARARSQPAHEPKSAAPRPAAPRAPEPPAGGGFGAGI